MRAPGIVLCCAALTLMSCSDDDSGADPTDAPDSTTAPAGSDGSSPDTAASPDASSPPATSDDDDASGLPGGTAGAELLREHSWLDDDGRLYFGESEPQPDVQTAICEYLFGTVDEVAEVAGLDGAVTLHDGSGYAVLGGGGTGFRCGYDVSGDMMFDLVLWDQAPGDASNAAHVVTVELDNGLIGFSAYSPEFEGEPADRETVTAWLTAAGERIVR